MDTAYQAHTRRHEFKDATRILTSILAPIEKRTLIWLAHRMPARVNSDHLTALALLAMVGAGLSFWMASVTPLGLLLVVLFLAVNWFGDSLDGTLARVRQHQRPRYGFYVDHVVDAVGTLCLLLGLGLSGYMSPYVALGLTVAYFLLTIEVGLATHAIGQFKISYFLVGPTELRILLSIGALTLIVHPTATIAGREFLLFDVGGLVAIAGLLATFTWSAVTNGLALYRAEPIPTRPGK